MQIGDGIQRRGVNAGGLIWSAFVVTIGEEELLMFIRELANRGDEIDATTPLFSSGALDSMAMVQLITFVEEKFAIVIRAHDVTLEHFDTVARITEFVRAE